VFHIEAHRSEVVQMQMFYIKSFSEDVHHIFYVKVNYCAKSRKLGTRIERKTTDNHEKKSVFNLDYIRRIRVPSFIGAITSPIRA
jgi:hypothetical protein